MPSPGEQRSGSRGGHGGSPGGRGFSLPSITARDVFTRGLNYMSPGIGSLVSAGMSATQKASIKSQYSPGSRQQFQTNFNTGKNMGALDFLRENSTFVNAATSAYGAYSQNKQAKQQSSNQMAFQERMSNTAHQRQVADLRAAGLNPILSANSGASSPGGAQAPIVNPTQNAINTALQTATTEANITNVKAGTALTMSQTAGQDTKNIKDALQAYINYQALSAAQKLHKEGQIAKDAIDMQLAAMSAEARERALSQMGTYNLNLGKGFHKNYRLKSTHQKRGTRQVKKYKVKSPSFRNNPLLWKNDPASSYP